MMSADEKTRQLALIREKAKEQKARWTPQRQIIVEHFLGRAGHATIEELLGEIKAHDARASSATVYRTLNFLVDIGVAVRRDFGDAAAVFELNIGDNHHDHLIDQDTGAILEFENEEIEELQRLVAKQMGYELTDHHLVLYGKKIR